MYKRRIKVFAAAVAGLILLSGCTKKKEQANAASGTIPAVRTVVDDAGKTVVLPEKINRVVISSILPLPSVFCLFRGSAKEIVGMHPSSLAAAKNSYLANVYPEIADANTDFVKNGTINIEALLNLKPDVVFYVASNTQEGELFEKAGIPAVGFSVSLDGWNSVETYARWIKLLGGIYGEEEKSDKIIKAGRQMEQMIKERMTTLDEKDKPHVLVLFNYANNTIKTSGSNFFGQYWIETAGGINVASVLDGRPSVNMEQIYQWNPDMIFITNFSPYLPEDLYNNTIEGHDWSTVKAVKDHKVYKFPLGMYRWFPPCSDTPLALLWLAKTIHPELFSDIDMNTETKNYYEKNYNVKLTDDDVYRIYHPVAEASGIKK